MKKCCVIGSINVDMTITLPHFHRGGETIAGTDYGVYPGGKGGNQAVALGRLGAKVGMAGAVGADANGRMYLDVLNRERVDAELVASIQGATTGVALIEVESASGENRIAISAGANAKVDRAYIDGIFDRLLDYDLFLMQFEIPMDSVTYAARRLFELGKRVILDPAPAPKGRLDPDLLRCVDFITPNETELASLTGMQVDSAEQIQAAALELKRQGVRAVIAKMGAAGAMLVDDNGVHHLSGFPVHAVDTTAAGDSFNAGFAYALAEGMEPVDAVRFANAAGALATTRMGAQSGMPTRAMVERLLSAT